MQEHWIAAFSQSIHGEFLYPDPVNLISGLDAETAGKLVPGLPNSIYQIVYHMTAWGRWGLNGVMGDSFDKAKEVDERNLFPESVAPTEAEWEAAKSALGDLIADFDRSLAGVDDLGVHRDWGGEFNNGRALLFVVSHTGYHTAQIVALRRLVGKWEG